MPATPETYEIFGIQYLGNDKWLVSVARFFKGSNRLSMWHKRMCYTERSAGLTFEAMSGNEIAKQMLNPGAML